ncbi:MAG: ligase-associated DNA damage response endonuclease PdeM [bacterium]|nr:ligase-associated DNA damage response endonuclease PdeM [bacterium]
MVSRIDPMTDRTAALDLHGEHLILLPERALYWPRTRTLFIADLHLGKAAAFRAGGVPLPEGTTAADLSRLSRALDVTGARKLIILGDFWHAAAGRDAYTLDAFAAWRAHHAALSILMVRGNHDRGAGDPPPEWEMRVLEGPTPGPLFVCAHEPVDPAHGYALTGHVHPAAALSGRGRQRLTLPCFWFRARHAVLPAFSGFTGGTPIQPTPGDRLFAITPHQVVTLDPAP